jgi:hypothetical protein
MIDGLMAGLHSSPLSSLLFSYGAVPGRCWPRSCLTAAKDGWTHGWFVIVAIIVTVVDLNTGNLRSGAVGFSSSLMMMDRSDCDGVRDIKQTR